MNKLNAVIVGDVDLEPVRYFSKIYSIKGDHGIHADSDCYWIKGAYLDMDMFMAKSCLEGMTISHLIQSGKPLEEIQDYIEDVLISHANRDLLKGAVRGALSQEFERGQKAKAREIREVLGVAPAWD